VPQRPPDPNRFAISPAPMQVELLEEPEGDDDEPEPTRGPPRRAHFHASLQADTHWYTDPSFDFFSSRDASTAPGITLGYGVDLGGDLVIVPELAWSGNADSESSLFGGVISEATLSTNRYSAGASVRYELLSFLDPHIRLSAGVTAAEVAIDTLTGSIEQDETLFSGTLGAGFTVHTPAGVLGRRRFMSGVILGLTAEGGYTLESPMEVSSRTTDKGGRIPITESSLGKVERSAPYLRIAGAVRF
jgi:hypothetical protein